MSQNDNYGGAGHDPAFDEGDTIDWNPVEHRGDIDDAIWSQCWSDPAGWKEHTVEALVFEVEVPEHDAEGNATDGSPYIIPPDLIGATTCYVAGTYFDWGDHCDGVFDHC